MFDPWADEKWVENVVTEENQKLLFRLAAQRGCYQELIRTKASILAFNFNLHSRRTNALRTPDTEATRTAASRRTATVVEY
jgi:hypothetical protein